MGQSEGRIEDIDYSTENFAQRWKIFRRPQKFFGQGLDEHCSRQHRVYLICPSKKVFRT